MSNFIVYRVPQLDIRLLPAVLISWGAGILLAHYRFSIGQVWILLVLLGIITGLSYLGYVTSNAYLRSKLINNDRSNYLTYIMSTWVVEKRPLKTIPNLLTMTILMLGALTVVSVSWNFQYKLQEKQRQTINNKPSVLTVLLQRDVYGINGQIRPKSVGIWQTPNGNFSVQPLNIEFRHIPQEFIAQGSQILVVGKYRALSVANKNIIAKSAGNFIVDNWRIVRSTPGVYQIGAKIRENLYAATQGLDLSERALILGIATGDDRMLPEADKVAMRTVALSHLTAVSGSHVTLFMMIFLALGSCFTNRDSWIMAWMFGGLLIILGLVAPEPAVLRASLMAILVLWARMQGYQVMMLPVLLLTVLCALWWWPSLATEYGFAFSVFSTAGLLLAVRRVKEIMVKVITPNLAIVVAVPVVAQIACLPLLILLGQGLPLYGVVSNLLVLPVILPITIGGIVAGIIYSFCPYAAQIGIWVAQLGTKWMIYVARTLVQAPAATLPWPGGVTGIIIFLLVISIIYILVNIIKLKVEWVSFIYKASRVIVFVVTSYFFWTIYF